MAQATGTSIEQRRAQRAAMVALTDRLIAEFSGIHPARAVIRHVAHAREECVRAGMRSGLVRSVETMTRTRLGSVVPPHTDPS